MSQRRFSGLVQALAIAAFLAFTLQAVDHLVAGLSDVQPARVLAAEGRVAMATDSLVYLETGRGTSVGAVRVKIQDRTQLLYLSDITQTATDLDDFPLGWQPATEATGYVPPFQIRYLVSADGVPVAMAVSDLAGKGTYRPFIAAGAYLLGAALAAFAWFFHGRRIRNSQNPSPNSPDDRRTDAGS